MPHEITNHSDVLDAIRRTDTISELVEEMDGKFTYELDLEVIAYGRNYTGKKVGPYENLLLFLRHRRRPRCLRQRSSGRAEMGGHAEARQKFRRDVCAGRSAAHSNPRR